MLGENSKKFRCDRFLHAFCIKANLEAQDNPIVFVEAMAGDHMLNRRV